MKYINANKLSEKLHKILKCIHKWRNNDKLPPTVEIKELKLSWDDDAINKYLEGKKAQTWEERTSDEYSD